MFLCFLQSQLTIVYRYWRINVLINALLEIPRHSSAFPSIFPIRRKTTQYSFFLDGRAR